MTWTHYPETGLYGEYWHLHSGGLVVATVVCHSDHQYSACIYPLGKSKRVGDAYGSAAAAKAACVRQLRKTGVLT